MNILNYGLLMDLLAYKNSDFIIIMPTMEITSSTLIMLCSIEFLKKQQNLFMVAFSKQSSFIATVFRNCSNLYRITTKTTSLCRHIPNQCS